ncbi:MAG: DNA helicase RecG, partial [Dehalococcoidales bacterium]
MSLNGGSLRKILDLEGSKGYKDSAVIGGLDRFIRNWAVQIAESITTPALLRHFKRLKLADSRYASLSGEQRKEWVEGILAFLAQAEGKKPEKPKAKPTPSNSKPVPEPEIKSVASGNSIDSPITVIKGISANLATRFNKMGLRTVRDLLYFFPHRHLDYSQTKSISQLTEGVEETIIANV